VSSLRLVLGILFLGAFCGLNVFFYRRMVRDVTKRQWLRRLGIIAMVALFAAIPLTRFFGARYSSPTWSAVAFSWLGLSLHMLLALVAAEVVQLAWRRRQQAPLDPAKRQLLARTVAVSAATVGAGLSGFGAYRAFSKPQVSEVPVRLPGLPKALDGFTLVQLTDIHVGAIIQERFLDTLVEVANRCRPDLIAITGDLVDGRVADLGRFVARLQRLQSRYGTHFVSGNHDYYSGWDEWGPALSGLGWTVLQNRLVSIGDAGASFDLMGVNDYGSRQFSGGYDLAQATANHAVDRASVLLSHQPQNISAVTAAGIGLQLSGHTHGGQLFPGTVIGSAIWGSLNTGLSTHGVTQVYTSRGCGFVGPPMRVGAPPEVVKVVLVAGS
jgi:uncharacterized protein